MKKKIIFSIILNLLIFKNSSAADHAKFSMDVYGTQQITAQQVLNKYKNELQTGADIIMNINHNHSDVKNASYKSPEKKIIAGLKKEGSFAYLNLSPIMYPNNDTLYITVDAVDLKDKDRLSHFISKPTQNIPDPNGLIRQYLAYHERMGNIIYSQHRFPMNKHCSGWFCAGAFGDPTLKKQSTLFTQQVPQYQTQLGRVLNLDKNPEKRAAAAFLLGFAPSSQALARTLIASMKDPDDSVRNNTILVLSEVLSRITLKDFPVADTVQMLDFPLTTDRNKTLYLILSLSRHPAYAQYYAKHAGKLLVSSLKMQQPNLHKGAFAILKKISGKSYGERDYQKWEQWAEAQSKKA